MSALYKYLGLPAFLLLCLFAFQRNYEANLWDHLAERAGVNLSKGNTKQAKRLIQSSLKLAEKHSGNSLKYFQLYYSAGIIDLAGTDVGLSDLYLKKALLILENNSGLKQLLEGKVQAALGTYHFKCAQFDLAKKHWENARIFYETSGESGALIWVYYHLSLIYSRLNQTQESLPLLHKAKMLADTLPENFKDLQGVVSSVQHALALELLQTEPEEAYEAMENAIAFDFKILLTDSPLLGRTYYHSALLSLHRKETQTAIHQLNQAQAIFEKADEWQSLKDVYQVLINVYENQERFFLAGQYRTLQQNLSMNK